MFHGYQFILFKKTFPRRNKKSRVYSSSQSTRTIIITNIIKTTDKTQVTITKERRTKYVTKYVTKQVYKFITENLTKIKVYGICINPDL